MNQLLLILAAGLSGLSVIAMAATRPKRIWLLLITVSIVTSGLMPLGFSMVDEWLTGCIVLGMFMYLALTGPSSSPSEVSHITSLHRLFFLLMIAYMIVQAFRGVLVLESLRKVRWIVFYSMLGLLVIFLRERKFPIPSKRQVVMTVMLSTSAYLIFFIMSGVVAEFVGMTAWFAYGVGRWAVQTTWWGSSAYSMLPIAVAVPAGLISLRDRSRWHRRAGWCTLLLSFAAALYYDSRVALLSIFAFFIVMLPTLGFKRFAAILGACLLTLSVFIYLIWPSSRTYNFFLTDVFGSGSALWQEQKLPGSARDVDRWIHMQVAFNSITDDWVPLLFGYGFRTHGRIISPRVSTLYERYLPEQAPRIREDESTEGFTALVVDTGLVGLLLLAINFLLVAWQVCRERANEHRYLLLLSLTILFLWLFVINMLDVTLFYLAIMPSGLLLLMAGPSNEKPVHRLSSVLAPRLAV